MDQSPEGTEKAEVILFNTSALKLAIMSVVTGGLYEVFWMYQNWIYISNHSKKRLRAVWRVWFAYFWIYPLFRAVLKIGIEVSATSRRFKAGPLAIAWILLMLCAHLPGMLKYLGYLSFLPLLPVQRYINSLNPPQTLNRKFSVANWVGIVLGTALLILALIVEFLPARRTLHN